MDTAVDLFAGMGGWTTGARAAGVNVVWAANHWPTAVHWHAANHPETVHVCQDLQQANWSKVPWHNLLLASPRREVGRKGIRSTTPPAAQPGL